MGTSGRKPALIGRVLDGGASQVAQLAYNGQRNITSSIATLTGGATANTAARSIPTRGRLPNLWAPRDPTTYGKNSRRLIGQEVGCG